MRAGDEHPDLAGLGVARLAAGAGLVMGGAYLLWRATATIGGAPLWLALPTFAVEVVAYLAVAVLVWALWRAPLDGVPVPTHDRDVGASVEIAVRCHHQSVDALRATLLTTTPLAAVTVVDLHGRADVSALCAELGATLLAPDPDDLDGLITAARAATADAMLVLDAGDVPHPHILRRTVPWLTDPKVAVVQAAVTSSPVEVGETGVGGRHDHAFERRALNPALGARGMAALVGSGALVRPAAVAVVPTGDTSSPMVHAHITTALLEAGWRVVAPGGRPLVASSPISQPDQVELARACEASAARHLLLGHGGALRGRRLGIERRLALVALSVRPLAGIRRSVVVAIVCASLLSGHLPFAATWQGMALLWAPWMVLSAGGLFLLSHGTMWPGDRLRWSMRMLGASWRGALSPNGRLDRPEPVLADAFGLAHGGAPAAAVAALSVAIGLRAVSDRVTHTLNPVGTDELIPLLVLALWTLAGGLDALRILARRAQNRRASRVVSSLPSTLADRASLVVDLTPLGAGVMADVDLAVGSLERLDVVVPTASGCVSASVPVVVRNVRADFSGERHIGVEFVELESYVADALVEYCIVQPALEGLGGAPIDPAMADLRPVVISDGQALGPRRLGLRAAALVAVMGAMVSAVPPRAEASAAASLRGSVVVADGMPAGSAAGALVTVVCAQDEGADGRFGTSDDSFGGPRSVTATTDGSFEVPVTGRACWWSLAAPVGWQVDGSRVDGATAPRVADLTDGALDPVRLRPASAPAAGSTAADGATDVATDVADIVWTDLDADGIIDDGEQGIERVTVALLDGGGAVRATTLTGEDGTFRFAAVPAGSHRLAVSNMPTDLVVADPTGMSAPFAVAAGTDVGVAIPARPLGAVEPPAVTERILPAPPVGSLAEPVTESTLAALLVVLLAALIGLSVVLGSVGPIRFGAEHQRTRQPA